MPASNSAEIEHGLEILQKRGPDGSAFYSDDHLSMGMTRLAIVGSDHLDQPSIDCTGKIRTVFNGEIYNFRELRQLLILKGHAIASNSSDASVIPHLFEEYGIKFINKLHGMFAIILWDASAKKLYLFRDSSGIKPLYFATEENCVLVASEVRAVFALSSKNFQISEENLLSFTRNQMVYSPKTIWNGILSVPPGTFVELGSEGLFRITRWNQTHFPRRSSEPHIANKVTELDKLLNKAVEEQFFHGTTPGILLSGGLDSSIIASYIARLGKTPDSYHLYFENASDSKEEDRRYSEELASKLGFNHNEIKLDGETYFRDLDDCLDSFQQPFVGVTSMYFIAREISKLHKSCITGDGADELFGSYRRVQHFAKLHYSGVEYSERTAWVGTGSIEEQLNAGISSSDLTDSVDDKIAHFLENDLAYKSVRNDFDGALMFDQLRLLPEQVLLYSDHLSMVHGLEIRPPFLSESIMKFARSIPVEFLIDKEGETKKILKKLAEKFLPAKFINRKKEGFSVPLEYWLKQDYGKDWIYSNLEKLNDNVYLYLNRSRVTEVTEAFLKGQHSDFFLTYRIIVLSRFLNKIRNL